MLKLTRMSRYAIKAVVFLAEQQTDRPITHHVIGEATGVSEQFLMASDFFL